MFETYNILLIKYAYAGTGSAQDFELLVVSIIAFLVLLLLSVFIYEQIRKFISFLSNLNKSDFDDNAPGGDLPTFIDNNSI